MWWKGGHTGEREEYGHKSDTNIRDTFPFSSRKCYAVYTRDYVAPCWDVQMYFSQLISNYSLRNDVYFGTGRTPIKHPVLGSTVEPWLYLWPSLHSYGVVEGAILCLRCGPELRVHRAGHSASAPPLCLSPSTFTWQHLQWNWLKTVFLCKNDNWGRGAKSLKNELI